MREKRYYKDMKGTQEKEKGTRTKKNQIIEMPAAQAEAIEDALLCSVKALPFPADDIFRGSGDGTREYTALFVL